MTTHATIALAGIVGALAGVGALVLWLGWLGLTQDEDHLLGG